MKFVLKVVLYVAVVVALAWGAALAIAIEPAHILLGSATANYYDEHGSLEGRSKRTGDKIEIFESNAFAGRYEVAGNKTTFYDRGGAVIGWAYGSRGNYQIYKAGVLVGRTTTSGNTATIYDKYGAVSGRAEIGNITRFYSHNAFSGRKE
jgi:hypothetical protein